MSHESLYASMTRFIENPTPTKLREILKEVTVDRLKAIRLSQDPQVLKNANRFCELACQWASHRAVSGDLSKAESDLVTPILLCITLKIALDRKASAPGNGPPNANYARHECAVAREMRSPSIAMPLPTTSLPPSERPVLIQQVDPE